jgi:hypothetical protein
MITNRKLFNTAWRISEAFDLYVDTNAVRSVSHELAHAALLRLPLIDDFGSIKRLSDRISSSIDKLTEDGALWHELRACAVAQRAMRALGYHMSTRTLTIEALDGIGYTFSYRARLNYKRSARFIETVKIGQQTVQGVVDRFLYFSRTP